MMSLPSAVLLPITTHSIAIVAMTVISFLVKVPVLSEQICVAPPIVSADASLRTRFSSFYILALAKLREMVTARGNPSGMATTTTVIEIMTASKSIGYTWLSRLLKSYGSQVPSTGY
jgi:hypothetical protein